MFRAQGYNDQSYGDQTEHTRYCEIAPKRTIHGVPLESILLYKSFFSVLQETGLIALGFELLANWRCAVEQADQRFSGFRDRPDARYDFLSADLFAVQSLVGVVILVHVCAF